MPFAERLYFALAMAFTMARLRTREAAPTIVDVQEQFERLRLSELERQRAKLGPLTPQQEEALDALTKRFPALSRHVRDDSGQIRQFLNIYLNEEDIRFLGGESCALREGDRVLLVPSIAGGAPGC